LKNKELLSTFIDQLKIPSEITIALPEKDKRINDATKILKEIGLNIICLTDLNKDQNNTLSLLETLKFSNNWPKEDLIIYSKHPFIKSLSMLRKNQISGVVCGCTMPSSDVIRGSLRVIGLKKSVKNLSSMFLMINKNVNHFITFADCAVIPEPNSEQLAEIAFLAGTMHENITQDSPRIAFLSFSTKGSAQHYRVKNVQDAVKIFGKKYNQMMHEGEIQLDAALDSVIAIKKINNSTLKGNANTLIFPNLDAANIGYKLVQCFAFYYACGPLLMGLNKPVNDLSRGAKVEDIVLVTLLTALQIQRNSYADL
jgi:phosphate acetyltransferase